MSNAQLEKAKTNADNMAGCDRQGRKHGVTNSSGSYQVWVVKPNTEKDYVYVTGEVIPSENDWDDLLS